MAVARCSKERIRIYLSSYQATYLGSQLFITYLSLQQCDLFSYTRYIMHLSGSFLFSISALFSARVALLTQQLASYIVASQLYRSVDIPSYCAVLCILVKSWKKTFLLVMYQHIFESPYRTNFFMFFSHSFYWISPTHFIATSFLQIVPEY